jgi:hypothetical protein
MCLPSRCQAMNVKFDFTLPAFGRHVTISLSLPYRISQTDCSQIRNDGLCPVASEQLPLQYTCFVSSLFKQAAQSKSSTQVGQV